MAEVVSPIVEELTEEACWSLLASVDSGRIAVIAGSGVDIFPVNFLVKDRVLFFRSAPGSKLALIAEHPEVAFEADGVQRRVRWSVVVKGLAQRLNTDAEIEASGVLGLHTLDTSEKWNYVQVAPQTVSGRRFTGQRRSIAEMAKSLLGGSASSSRGQKSV